MLIKSCNNQQYLLFSSIFKYFYQFLNSNIYPYLLYKIDVTFYFLYGNLQNPILFLQKKACSMSRLHVAESLWFDRQSDNQVDRQGFLSGSLRNFNYIFLFSHIILSNSRFF